MNYTLFITMAIFVNTFLAAIFPTQLGLDDPLGIENIRAQKFSNFDTNTQQYFIDQGVFNEDGTPGTNFETYEELQTAGESEAGVIITDLGLSFTDYFKIGWNAFISTGVFLMSFVVILFGLPLNIAMFIAPMISTLGIISLVKFVTGRT